MIRRTICTCAAILGFLLFATDPGVEEQLWRHRNLGKALFESPTNVAQAPAELKKALDLAPNSFRERLNYGLALLRAGELDASIVELEKAEAQNPKNPHVWFNLGIAYKRKMRHADAIRQFEGMARLVPDEPVTHYNLGLLYDLAGRGADALKQFQIAADLDQWMVAPRYQIYNYHRLHDAPAEAAKALTEFKRVKDAQQEAGDSEDMEWSFYAELFDPAIAHPAAHDQSAPVDLKFAGRSLPGRVDAKTAGLLAVDASGMGRADLLVWSSQGIRLFRNGTVPVAQPALAALKGVVSAAAGDFDNDGLSDLCVLTAAGPGLYRNAKGRFVRVAKPLPQGRFDIALWLDFDHDYDLDLFLFGARPVLLRNEGSAGWRDYTAHFPFAPGRAAAATAIRVVPDTKGVDLAVAYAARGGVLYRDRLRGKYEATPLDIVPPDAAGLEAADLDNDGWIDLICASSEGAVLAANREGRFEKLPVRLSGAFVLADLENRGLSDLLGGRTLVRNQGRLRLAPPKPAPGLPDGVAWEAADFDGDGRLDLASIKSDGTIEVAINQMPAAKQWLRVTLDGVKNMKSAAGAEVEVKSGDVYRKAVYQGVPLLFGLGDRKHLDSVRITWPNGMVQNEMNQAAGRQVKYKEAPRLSGSCPMIFTWNGREFEFITDVLGVAPLGASSGDGGTFPLDHDEYVQIPAESLRPENGRLEVRITEELHEVSYLDQVRLIALDHPAGVDVFTNEKFKSPPFPEFRLYGARERVFPSSARDGAGRDQLPAILERDRRYAAGFRHDHAGVAEMHSLTLDFGDAARDNRAALFLHGWVDWADGSTFYGASQSGKGLVFPYLQVKDPGGKWQTVVEDMGIPAGKPKTMVVDLSGKFLSASRQVRIVTNLCVYWDQVFLAGSSAPEVRMTPVPAASADLRLRGFSRPVIHPRREQPEAFEYARWTPGASWNQTPGMYTRYGDVRELIETVDDRMAIFGAGDELRFSFDPSALPSVPEGWRRDYLLYVDGWAKDADANTAYSQSVEPLPFHGMSGYPYPANEQYPDGPVHRAYRKLYNTRPAIRLVPPLVAGPIQNLQPADPGNRNRLRPRVEKADIIPE